MTERGLPSNTYAERMVLGSILLNDDRFAEVAGILKPEDFSVESNRRIYRRMCDMAARGEKIDHVTLANELMRFGELEEVGGLSGLVSFEEGLPELYNLVEYAQIVRERSDLRRVIFTTTEIQNRAFLAQDKAIDIVSGALQKLQSIGADQVSGIVAASDVIDRAGGMDGMLAPVDDSLMPRSGFVDVDKVIPHFAAGSLIVVGGAPSSGKTAWALNVAANVAIRQGYGVSVFSYEMCGRELIDRIACAESRVPLWRVRSGSLTPSEEQDYANALAAIYDAPLWIDDSGAGGLMEIESKVKRLNARLNAPPVRMVVVDYLQLMPTPIMGKNANRVQEIGALSRGLKLMAQRLAVPIIALSQLSRAVDERPGHVPQLSDLRESGSIEQDASAVLFVHRPEKWAQTPEEAQRMKGDAKIIIAKQRNGPLGYANLTWLGKYTKFEDRAPERETTHWQERD